MSLLFKKFVTTILAVSLVIGSSFSHLSGIVQANSSTTVVDSNTAYQLLEQVTNPSGDLSDVDMLENAPEVEGTTDSDSEDIEIPEAIEPEIEEPESNEGLEVEADAEVEGTTDSDLQDVEKPEATEPEIEEPESNEGLEVEADAEVEETEDEYVPNYDLDSSVVLSSNFHRVSAYLTTGTEVTTSGFYNLNGLKANSVADLNTSDSYQNSFGSGDTRNNGRVWVDKSVTLDDDFNYDTFTSIENGDFNVILSALGQDFTTEQSNPADVVFVLDMSNSMTANVSGSKTSRAEAMVNAVNLAMDTLISANPNTRIGIVTYNSTSSNFLELGKYSLPESDTSGKYLTYQSGYSIKTSANLLKDGAAISQKTARSGQGTYTQLGIQTGANMLINSGNENNIPCLILLSDGDPTKHDTNYTNVGTGSSVSSSAEKGYYTILTAQHQKQRIKANYTKFDVQFYTLGLGITDIYPITVLNPTPANVASCASGSDMAKTLRSKLLATGSGYLNASYATKSESKNMTQEELNTFLNLIATAINKTATHPLSSSLVFEDVIGEGMTVGDTIYVRYNGTNYSFTKNTDGTYTRSTVTTVVDSYGNTQSLNDLTIKVEGNKLTWTIPRVLVPVYANSTTTNTAFTRISPIRLIYKVGVSSTVAGTYYTNAFTESNGIPQTTAKFTMVSNNPYTYTPLSDPKPNNETETAANATALALNGKEVTATLGNNGKVTMIKEVIDFKVTKQWSDYDNKHKTRPSEITVQLQRDGVNEGAPVTLNVANNWSDTWEDLPTMASDNHQYVYTVVETNVPDDYTSDIAYTSEGATITNTLKNVTERTVTKTWSDNNNSLGLRPESIKVQLKQNGENYLDVVTVKANDNWRYTWSNLPKYDADGNEYVYTVQEVNVSSDYAPTYNQGTLTITNTLTNVTQKTVTKIWSDYNDVLGLRPTQIQVELLQGITVYDTVDLKAENDWSYTWEWLPKSDANGKDYVYTVREITKDENYQTSYNQDTLTITNTLIEKGTIKLNKTDKEGNRLVGAKFKLEIWNGTGWDTLQMLTTTDEMLTVTDLAFGTYKLTEMKTAGSHSLLPSSIEFSIPYVQSDAKLPNGVSIDPEQGNGKMPTLIISVRNNPNGIFEQLPSTGGTGVLSYIISGGFVIGLSLILYSRTMGRKKIQ